MSKGSEWKPLDFAAMRARLVEVKTLLEQAAAVGLAQDAQRLEALSALMQRSKEQEKRAGKPDQRRYR